MTVLPSEIPTGLVVAQFYFVSEDNIDVDTDPSLIPVTGNVTFTCSVKVLRMPGRAATVIPLVFKARFDAQGRLIAVNDPTPGLKLPATDTTDISPRNYTWRVDFDLVQADNGYSVNIPSFDIQVPAGTTVDLTAVMPVDTSPGTITIAGPSNVLSVGTVTTGAPGSSASATITGNSPLQVLGLTIPRGDVGPANTDASTFTTGTMADARLPTRLSDTALSATYVPKWKATTAYLAGDAVLSPAGDTVTAKVNFTSGASYNAANWNLSPTLIPKWRASTAYIAGDKVISPNGDVVSAISAFTSGTVYNPVNWVLSPTTAALISAGTAPGGTVITDDATFKLNDPARSLYPVKEVACWGHSMMASNGGIISTRINTLLGVPTYNLGIGGNTSTDIAIRSGGVIPLLTFTGGSIPADTSAVAVTVQPTREYLIATGGSPFTYTGTVAGIPGTLSYATATGLWTFARTTAGTLTTVASGTPFLITSSTYSDRVAVIWPGRNNLYSQSGDMRNVTRDVDAMVGALTPYFKRYVVLSDITASTETSGTSIYTKTIASNTERAARYGKNYYDLRRDFIDQGLALAGITATAGDLTAIAGDAPPPSLMNVAGDHPNDAGYTVVGTLISRFLGTLGWGFVYISTNKLTTNQASFETDTTGWSSNGDGNIVIARSTLQAAHGVASLEITAGPTAANVLISSPGIAVTPGQYWAVQIQSRAAVTPRARKIELYWYNSSNGFLAYGSGSSTTDNTTGWTTHTVTGTVAPASAAFLRIGLATTGAANLEKHYIDKAGASLVGSAGAAVPVWELP